MVSEVGCGNVHLKEVTRMAHGQDGGMLLLGVTLAIAIFHTFKWENAVNYKV